MIILAFVAIVILCSLLITLYRKQQRDSRELSQLKDRYKDITSVENEINKRNAQVSQLDNQLATLQTDLNKQKETLEIGIEEKQKLFAALSRQLAIVEEKLDIISYGLYQPHFNFQNSEEYKAKRESIWNDQKTLIQLEKATYCATEWSVGGSKKEGEKMTKQASKLMLRAFNGECDSAIAKVTWNNITVMESRIQKAYEGINKLGSSNKITITQEYLALKLNELRIEFELQEKIQQEKEEQRRIKEQMREEERAQAEIEKAKKQADAEEEKYQIALAKARQEAEQATGAKMDSLAAKIKELEENLQQAKEMKERAISRAQLTKSGHVYIISNVGSFGEDVYKIGMTRRLEPMDRIYELSDASVPFDFDVHAIIFSENAPELERKFHIKLGEARVNLVNERKEFFNISLHEIEQIAREFELDFQLTKLAEAKEYRTTLSMRESKTPTLSPLQQMPAAVAGGVPESLQLA